MRVVITGFRLPVHLIDLSLGGDDALHALIIDAGLGGLEEAGRAADENGGSEAPYAGRDIGGAR